MARPVPLSPALKEAALDAALASAPTPTLPPGMAARIIANATALAQLPPEPTVEPEVAEAMRPTSAKVIAFAPPEPKVRAPRRRIFAITGLAALAAGVAAVIVAGPADRQAVIPGAGAGAGAVAGAPAPMIAAAPPPAPAAAPAAPPVQLVEGEQTPGRADVSTPPTPAPLTQTPVAAVPETRLATSGERSAVAVDGPADGPQAGPTAGPNPGNRIVPNGGLMGPPAPQQGWSYTGGAPGSVTLPGGSSFPGQTA
ncbi:MAG: hypothetical protein C0409_03715, partial [Novosphingobium sp.]|nr:hypothetical protein [Novosphingobium sp.]